MADSAASSPLGAGSATFLTGSDSSGWSAAASCQRGCGKNRNWTAFFAVRGMRRWATVTVRWVMVVLRGRGGRSLLPLYSIIHFENCQKNSFLFVIIERAAARPGSHGGRRQAV